MTKLKPRVPRILVYDIESTPNIGFTWAKYDQNVLDFIKERELLSFAYCWLGEDGGKIFFEGRKGEKTDKRLVKKLAALYDEADVIVAHNGDSFDQKVVKARMLFHSLPPPKVLCTVDTKKASSAYFGFNGNSLDDLARFLKLGRKMSTPGMSMWFGCMAGTPAYRDYLPEKYQKIADREWKRIERYNKHDVRLLVRAYGKLKSWILNHPNVSRLAGGSALRTLKDRPPCPYCGGANTRARSGLRVTKARVYRQHQCLNLKCRGSFDLTLTKKELEAEEAA